MKEHLPIRALPIIVFLIATVPLFGVTFSYATSSLELTLRDLCRESSDIIEAKVISLQSYVSAGENRIYTKVELEVVEKMKAQLEKYDTLAITQYGGTVNGITTIVVGSPIFRIGQKSVLFLLERNSVGNGKNFVVVGMAQGKFNVFVDPITKGEKVVREQIDTALQIEKGGPRLPLAAQQAMLAADFISWIKRCLAVKQGH